MTIFISSMNIDEKNSLYIYVEYMFYLELVSVTNKMEFIRSEKNKIN